MILAPYIDRKNYISNVYRLKAVDLIILDINNHIFDDTRMLIKSLHSNFVKCTVLTVASKGDC